MINKRITGGAMQLSFSSITLDYYPFHRAGMNPAARIISPTLCLIFRLFVSVRAHSLRYSYLYLFSSSPTSPGDSCVHWMHYSEATKTRDGWARNLLDEFKSNVEMLKNAVPDQQGPAPAQSSPQHGKHTHLDLCLV